MSTIIAGIFDNIKRADSAKAALLNLNCNENAISVFHNNSPGQHDIFPVGGDEDKDAGADKSHLTASGGAAIGAASIGLAAAAAGPIGVAAAVGVGAYTGALVGALSGTEEDVLRRQAGVVVAVNVDDVEEKEVIKILRNSGAQTIEEATGNLENGEWIDFNPLSSPHLLIQN